MTKRTLLALLLLLPALSTGCTRRDDPAQANGADSGNADRQTNRAGGNSNGTDSVGPVIPFTREDKSVAVVVYADGGGVPRILVAPDPIRLLKGRGQKLRFHVFNDTEVEFSRVEFTFADNPFDGAFEIDGVSPGGDEGGAAKRIRGAAREAKYKYTIKVYGPDPSKPPIVELDPEVEIAT